MRWLCVVLVGAAALEAPAIVPRTPMLVPVHKFPGAVAWDGRSADVAWVPMIAARQPALAPPLPPPPPPTPEAAAARAASLPQVVPRQPVLREHPPLRETGDDDAVAEMARLREETARLETALNSIREAFAESLVTAHDARLQRDKEFEAVKEALTAELASTRAAFSAHLIGSHEKALAETAALREQIAAKDDELATAAAEFEELRACLAEHVERSEDILERQGDELRVATKRLANVVAAVAGVRTKADDTEKDRQARP